MTIRKMINLTRSCGGSRTRKPRAYEIRLVRTPQFEKASKFMCTRSKDDPLLQWVQKIRGESILNNGGDKYNWFFQAIWLDGLKYGISLQVIHTNHMKNRQAIRNYDRNLCGISVNVPYYQNRLQTDSTKLIELLQKNGKIDSSKILQTVLASWMRISNERIISAVDQSSQRTMKVAGIAVAPTHRNRGIAEKLMRSSILLATLMGYHYVQVDCTNPITAKICERNGFDLISELPFDKTLNEEFQIPLLDNEKVRIYLKKIYKNNQIIKI